MFSDTTDRIETVLVIALSSALKAATEHRRSFLAMYEVVVNSVTPVPAGVVIETKMRQWGAEGLRAERLKKHVAPAPQVGH